MCRAVVELVVVEFVAVGGVEATVLFAVEYFVPEFLGSEYLLGGLGELEQIVLVLLDQRRGHDLLKQIVGMKVHGMILCEGLNVRFRIM